MNELSTTWKKSLEPIPSHTTLSLVSLYDLLYDSDGTLYGTSAAKAFKLPHDIICYNTALYSEAGGNIKATGETSWSQDFISNGIDISIPNYDVRANLRFVECNITYSESNNYAFPQYGNTNKHGFYIKEREAALAPSNIKDFIENGVKINIGDTGMPSNYKFTSVQEVGDGSNGDILLTNEDTSFKGTLVTTANLQSYNNIFLNSSVFNDANSNTINDPERDSFLLKLIIKAFGFANTNNFVTQGDNTNSSILNYQKGKVNLYAWKDIYTKLISITNKTTGYEFLEDDDNLFKFMCRNTFVWVRCPFFGDYISPDSFMQDLNTESKVKFNELILGKEQDLRMFDETLTGKESDKTETYIPRVSPTIDLISKKYISGENGIAGDNSIITEGEDTAAKIDKFLDNNIHIGNSKFKGIAASPINRANTAELTPPNYFNKESRRDGEYYEKLRKFPTVLDNDGNAYVSGRIISPTIDEIWIMLKKLVSGRVADVAATETIKNNYSIPLGTAERENENDTTLSEVPDADFFVDNKYMDPLDYEISPKQIDGIVEEDLTLKVTNYVNQNDAIVYTLFEKLRDLSEKTTYQDEESEYKIDSKECLSVEENVAISDEIFGPRDIPFSLREIEALIKGNRYNIEALATYLKYNYGAVGKLGKVNQPELEIKDEDGNVTGTITDYTNFAAGSLFQFHKDYNYDFDKEFPSTVFNKSAAVDGKGKAAVFDDADNVADREKVSSYGVTNVLPEKANDYSSADVYLAADGNWRYIFDHVRLPILKEEF